MHIITIKYRRLLLFFFIIIIICLGIVNLKWIGKKIYPLKYRKYIVKYSNEYDIDPLLVASIIRVESKFDTYAQSHKGARGLMQISRQTGRWGAEQVGIEDYTDDMLFEPEINIKLGCWYISKLNEQFDNNLPIVIAAYNGGSGNVTKWLANEKYSSDGITLDYIPFKETDQYVDKVLKNYKIYKILYNNEM
ncbi:lytic transglycosylase domain-containing protein [Caldisalinibacter kiritimatiensis]|uniref:Soluble lytic murein transglycosylase n=1 Tax=Caldisalinibacter kiritimatiensis TaxID=1304284 RepID=R1CMC0_9FIRM|nr:lytic transglycosylase domain-containing protein [Caldisalinibacter kiritimatiensis]EOC99850.1 Soluble lytic murein transglycosylase precursor [Caldisalinibacter kiritimatiensis]